MPFDPPMDWPANVSAHPSARSKLRDQHRKAFEELAAQIHEARVRELRETFPSRPTSEELIAKLMTMRAIDSHQLSVKLMFFSLELAKEAEFGQNPDLRLIPYFASIQRDCAMLLKTQPMEVDALGD